MAVVHQPIGIVAMDMNNPMFKFRDQPVNTECMYCKNTVISETKDKVGSYSVLMGCVICIVGGFCGCCVIPCFMKGCKDVEHYCPSCGRIMHTFRRM